jgi:DNA polymerase-1
MSRWLLIDGFNLMYRCFFATPALARADGFPTNALHGWVKSVWRLMDQEKPDHTVVFFDLGGAQDRLALHPEYKAQRKEMPEELAQQIPYVKALTISLGLAAVEQNGVESDDLLASCAVRCAAQGDEVLIVSSDKDFAQIVSDRIKLLLPPPSAQPKLGWRRLDASGVQEKFGVLPSQRDTTTGFPFPLPSKEDTLLSNIFHQLFFSIHRPLEDIYSSKSIVDTTQICSAIILAIESFPWQGLMVPAMV